MVQEFNLGSFADILQNSHKFNVSGCTSVGTIYKHVH